SSLKDKRSALTELADGRALATPATRPAEVTIGELVRIGADGAPIVDFAANPAGKPVPAFATARYDSALLGSAVALMLLDGDPARPLAIGLIAQPIEPDYACSSALVSKTDDVSEQLTLTAKQEIVLQCGRASIILTSAGKVLVRGAYLSLRSSGMHRIAG